MTNKYSVGEIAKMCEFENTYYFQKNLKKNNRDYFMNYTEMITVEWYTLSRVDKHPKI